MAELLHDLRGRRLYLTAAERQAFLEAAAEFPRPVRTLCGVLAHTGCRVSEALQLTPRRVDLAGRALVFESLKKRRRGVYRAVPVPPGAGVRPGRCHDPRRRRLRAIDAPRRGRRRRYPDRDGAGVRRDTGG